ncbi:hypothetical protein [Pseudarthrobacter sp. YAF2]|uniref:hypothetical protein n=1 Tax=Pseudarthrobacter sp. YAF2 TaxID=3233078 RepID=UPI003F960B9F
MPVYSRETLRSDRLPWVEVDDFQIFSLAKSVGPSVPTGPDSNGFTPYWGPAGPLASQIALQKSAARDRVVVVSGQVQAISDSGRTTLLKRDFIDIPESGLTLYNVGTSAAEVVRIQGHWEESLRTEICLFDSGAPCTYHYHDGDEYWFVFRGHFNLRYDNRDFAMRPGLMLAAGMGLEHGVPDPEEKFEAVVIATRLSGKGRDGMLVRELHGDPVPSRAVPESTWTRSELVAGTNSTTVTSATK